MNYLSTLITFLFITFTSSIHAQSSPCAEHDIFTKLDFWVGEWKVMTPQGQPAGENKISKILDNCAILEEWTGAGASRGKSFNFYNPQEKKWRQIWIDNFANPLFFDGEVRQDTMIYTGTSITRNGSEVMNKMILSKVSKDEVRQLWSQSSDHGETWTVAFDGQYLRKK